MNKRARNVPSDITPAHKHDCEACIFLGIKNTSDKTYDLYYCEDSFGGPSIIARHGEYGDYYSCKVSDMNSRSRDINYPLDWAYAAFVLAAW